MRRRRGRRSDGLEAISWLVGLGLLGIVLPLAGALVIAIARWLGDHAGLIVLLIATGIIVAAAIVRARSSTKRPARPPQPLAMSREPIPAGLRFAVLRRDGFRCAYCGRGESDGVKLHIDHLVPVARGGPTELGNLVTACADCNLGKSASDLIG